MRLTTLLVIAAVISGLASFTKAANQVDRLLASENKGKKIQVAPVINDWAFMRRAYVDLIGRIPRDSEIRQYMKWPASDRRTKLVDTLVQHDRFAERWTVFFADMLRIRSNRTGGNSLLAFVNKSIKEGMSYDELAGRLISANGKAGSTPEVGWILGDDADPMALAGATAQIFLGKRMSCAQCHDHPFDKWTQEEFYNLAAFFGKTRRVESSFGRRMVYTTESKESSVLWPPELDAENRKPRKPAFPYEVKEDVNDHHVKQLALLRDKEARKKTITETDPDKLVEDVLGDIDSRANKGTLGVDTSDSVLNIATAAKEESRKLKFEQELYMASELRGNLAKWITSPHNKQFARAFVNRVWGELMGSGFVNPLDDFTETNIPSHPKTLDYISAEFVASGFDLRSLLKTIIASDAYQRSHLAGADKNVRIESESAFVASRSRRMISEVMYDSIVIAGHLEQAKHLKGENVRTVYDRVRVRLEGSGEDVPVEPTPIPTPAAQPNMTMAKKADLGVPTGYDLEKTIELDFNKALMADEEAPKVEMLMVKSKEQIEAERMAATPVRRTYKYTYKTVPRTFDDNPSYNSSMRMATPAPRPHFLRVFGQPSREGLGEFRNQQSSMRQALMMINGKMIHEASRVGKLEPMYRLITGRTKNIDKAITLAYREILSREPNAEETRDAKELLAAADSELDGMADLRWVLLNCHEFKFLP